MSLLERRDPRCEPRLVALRAPGTTPELERLVEGHERGARLGPGRRLRPCEELLVAGEILRPTLEEVAVLGRREPVLCTAGLRVALERLAETDRQHLNDLACRRGRGVLRPEAIDQDLGADRLIVIGEQDAEEAPDLPRSGTGVPLLSTRTPPRTLNTTGVCPVGDSPRAI